MFIDAVKLQKEPEKKNRVRVTLHYGDEIQLIVEAIADTIDGFGSSSECPVRGKHTRFIYLSVFSSPSNTLKPTLFIHQQAPELRKETSLLFFGHLNQHLQAFHTDPPG